MSDKELSVFKREVGAKIWQLEQHRSYLAIRIRQLSVSFYILQAQIAVLLLGLLLLAAKLSEVSE